MPAMLQMLMPMRVHSIAAGSLSYIFGKRLLFRSRIEAPCDGPGVQWFCGYRRERHPEYRGVSAPSGSISSGSGSAPPSRLRMRAESRRRPNPLERYGQACSRASLPPPPFRPASQRRDLRHLPVFQPALLEFLEIVADLLVPGPGAFNPLPLVAQVKRARLFRTAQKPPRTRLAICVAGLTTRRILCSQNPAFHIAGSSCM